MNGYNNYGQHPGQQYPPQHGGYMNSGDRYSSQSGGGYGQYSSAMGFHSQGGHMGGNQGYQRRDNEPEQVLCFFREVAEGKRQCPEELRAVILGIVGEQANGMLAQYGYQQQGGDPEHHHRYKETLEELRDIPQVTEAVKRAGQYFENLTDEDKKVLQQILNRPSYKKMAQMVNMTPERFMEVKHGLEWKLKR